MDDAKKKSRFDLPSYAMRPKDNPTSQRETTSRAQKISDIARKTPVTLKDAPPWASPKSGGDA
ncbi:hypothetical protein J7400_19000 [Shimia sp. R9_2]|uniref:hypothetical protein n=1 Tax=Shimia sp. R9_2 TaxID=2821112 RepID=UPI001ADD3CE5|nr:hypothetical protein [Shimia sp. R9_2]MBO9398766.1 hypothetical protein [Shimia sp. R9_2]